MRKLVLAVGSFAAVLLLAVLVHVADQDARTADAESYAVLKAHARGEHPHASGQHPHAGGKHPHADGQHPHGRHHPRLKLRRGPHRLPGLAPAPLPGNAVSPGPWVVAPTCHLEGSTLVLDYTYRAGERVVTFFDVRDGVVVAGVHAMSSPGIRSDTALGGEARFALVDPPRAVRNRDGTDLPCPQRKP